MHANIKTQVDAYSTALKNAWNSILSAGATYSGSFNLTNLTPAITSLQSKPYKRVEYINNVNANGYLNLGAVNNNYRIDIEFEGNYSGSASHAWVYGGRNTTNFVGWHVNTNKLSLSTGGAELTTSLTGQGHYIVSHNFNTGVVNINGTDYTTTKGTVDCAQFCIFGFNKETSYTAVCRIYSCRVFNGNTLVYNLVPCVLTENISTSQDALGVARKEGTYGFWNTVNNKFYCATTGNAYYKEYQPLTYITPGSTAGPCINTLHNVTANTKVEMKFQPEAYENAKAFFGGSWAGNQFLFDMQSNSYYFHGSPTLNLGILPTTDIQIVEVDNSMKSLTLKYGSNLTSNYIAKAVDAYRDALYIYGVTASNRARFKLYYFEIYEKDSSGNTILTNKFIPCKLLGPLVATKDSANTARTDGTIGVWDLVTNKFYANAGTGAFTGV